MDVDFELRGFDEVQKALRLLPERLDRNVTNRAVAAGARIIRDEAKIRVPVQSGRLKKAIAVKKSRGVGKYQVGIRKPESRRAHLTEFGTVHSAAQPFIRPAIDTKAKAAIAEIHKKLIEGMEKEAAKLAGRSVK